MTKLKTIILEELNKFLNEVFDPNGGNIYEPPGLNASHVKLFETAEEIYQNSLNDTYWKEISNKFPKYNSEESDTNKAVNFILNNIKEKYPNNNWSQIEQDLINKIKDGIT